MSLSLSHKTQSVVVLNPIPEKYFKTKKMVCSCKNKKLMMETGKGNKNLGPQQQRCKKCEKATVVEIVVKSETNVECLEESKTTSTAASSSKRLTTKEDCAKKSRCGSQSDMRPSKSPLEGTKKCKYKLANKQAVAIQVDNGRKKHNAVIAKSALSRKKPCAAVRKVIYSSSAAASGLSIKSQSPAHLTEVAKSRAGPYNVFYRQTAATVFDAKSREINKYEKLMLSLQSPLPNEHQFALDTCLILSVVGENARTSNLNVLKKTPALLNMLLAHAGFYSDCGLRSLVEKTHEEAFTPTVGQQECYDFATFWERICNIGGGYGDDEVGPLQHNYQKAQLLCECYPGKTLSEVEVEILRGVDNSIVASTLKCCSRCRAELPPTPEEESVLQSYPKTLPMIQTSKSSLAVEKIGNRVEYVAEMIRNFSLDRGNIDTMAKNPTLLRFLLVAVQAEFRSLPQIAFDIMSNIFNGKPKPEETMEDNHCLLLLKSMITDFAAATFLRSHDRFKIVRSLDIMSCLATSEGLRRMQSVVKEPLFFERLFELLTLPEDVFLVIGCLECVFAMTEMSGEICNEIVRVRGSLKTLVAYITARVTQADVINKSTHLTAVLILRNIVKHSAEARRSLKQYESHLLNVVMFESESSWAVAEILFYMDDR